MDVAIHDHGTLDDPIALEYPDRYRDIVNRAEPFAMAGEGVMKASSYIEAEPVANRHSCG
jgi:hypothetical protein